MSLPVVKLHVFSDYICPFCYIGSQRLLQLRHEFDLQINWCWVELHPETPMEGEVIKAVTSPLQWQKMQAAVEALSEEDQIAFTLPQRSSNSRRALLLAEAAKSMGHEHFYQLHESLFTAYFVQGKDLAAEDFLLNVGQRLGLNQDRVREIWQNESLAKRLRHYQAWATQLGMVGLPSFVFPDQILHGVVSLAQLREVMQRSVAAR